MSLRPQAPAAAAPRPEDRLKTVLQVGMMHETPPPTFPPDPAWWYTPAESIQRQLWWTAQWTPEIRMGEGINSIGELKTMMGQEGLEEDDERMMVMYYAFALDGLERALNALESAEKEERRLFVAQKVVDVLAYRTFLTREASTSRQVHILGPPKALRFFVKTMREGYERYIQMGIGNERIQAAQAEAMQWLIEYDKRDDPFRKTGGRTVRLPTAATWRDIMF